MIKTITEVPLIYLGFASLHLICGHFISSWIYNYRFHKNPFALYKTEQKSKHGLLSKIIMASTFIYGINLILYAYSADFRNTIIGEPLWIINPIYGWLIGIIGLMGMLFSQYNMGEAFRIGQNEIPTTDQVLLKQTGIYHIIRNPIYFFSVLYLLGISLWVINSLAWASLIIIAMCIHGLVLQEEKFLLKKFGYDYQLYCTRVSRYLPSIKFWRALSKET